MAMTRVDWIVLNYGVSQVLTIIHTGVFAYVLLQYDTTASHWCICALYITFKTTSWISCHGSYVTWCNVTWHNVSKLFRWMGLLCPLGIYLSRNSSCSVLVFQSRTLAFWATNPKPRGKFLYSFVCWSYFQWVGHWCCLLARRQNTGR